MCEVPHGWCGLDNIHKMASWLFGFPEARSYGIFSDHCRPSVHHPPLLAAGPLWIPYGRPHFWPLGRQTLSARKIAKETTAKNPWPLETHRDSLSDSHSWWWARFGTRCVRCPMCGVAWTTCHKMASWLLDFSVASSEDQIVSFLTSTGLPDTCPHCLLPAC